MNHFTEDVAGDCTNNAFVEKIKEINAYRRSIGNLESVQCSQNLVWIAYLHTQDQNNWKSKGYLQ